ncbi:MAG: 50S ribosomal protein L3 [Phycisphaerales bacterium]|nr:50S ribosomal protein L3 [Phycisphaerales bacterium]
MKAAILGTKIGMTRVFAGDGTAIPVTVVQAGPCDVLQVKTKETDGYEAIQLGYLDKKPSRCLRPEIGHVRKANSKPKRFVRELRLSEATDKKVGDAVTVEMFADQEIKFVDIVGTTIGKGFQGVMKRHNFRGKEASHGVERKHRSAGSIGGSANLGKGRGVKKGKRMAGQMGRVRRTARNQALVQVDKDRHLLLIKGAVPGPKGGFVIVAQAKTKG